MMETGPGDALVMVDVQNDFLPGGALAVPEGDQVIAPLNRAIFIFTEKGLPLFASRDWHPSNHCSFRENGGPWPAHCVAGTPGAGFAAALDIPCQTVIVSKGCAADRDAYSAFDATGLAGQLAAAGVRRLFIGGLATDYCVRATALDAIKAGFAAVVLTDCCRAVEVNPGDGEKSLDEMAAAGAGLAESRELA